MLLALAVTFYGVLGAVLGSFLGCALYRLPRHISLTAPARSFCPGCGRTLTAPDLVPLLSYLWFKGRARCCGHRLSPLYLVAELATTLLVIYLGLTFGPDPAAVVRHVAGMFV